MTFTARSIDALKAYLRTAAVIDDAALATQPKESAPATILQTPGRGVQASQQPEGPGEFKGAHLAVPTLVDAFLEQGILCTVFGRKEVLTDNIDALLRSDILVVDWMLFPGDDGSMTAKFIYECAVRHPHALHMICIYTSANDLGAIEQKLRDFSPNLERRQDTPRAYSVGSAYVLIVDKNHKEEALPKLLLEAFAPLVGGLLRNAVLHSIGAIRTNTHALLNRFHPDLDPAFVTHRVYSTPCEDTEQHIIPMICSEIGNILRQEKISNWLNKENIWTWINKDCLKNNYQRFLTIINGNHQPLSTIFRSHIRSAIQNVLSYGINSKYKQCENDYRKKVYEIIQQFKSTIKSNKLKQSVMTGFLGAKEPSFVDIKLSMLMSCVHFYGNTPPIMQSGTIIKEIGSDNYYGCIQPPCDCLRIEQEGRPFLFTPLQKVSVDSSFDISFLLNDTDIPSYLSKYKKAYRVKTIHFIPSTAGENICAEPSSQGYIFKDADDTEYIFCIQLNEIHALRLIQTYSSDLARIGLMESDWQRRIASKN